MTASKDKRRFAAVAPLSDRGGGAKPAAKDAAPRTRSKKAARIIGALAAASHSTTPGERPEVSAQIDDSAHGEAGGGDRRAAARPDLSPGPSPGSSPGSSLGPSPGTSPGPNPESSSGPAPAPALETAAPEPDARHPQGATGTAAPAQDADEDRAINSEDVLEKPNEWQIAPSAIDFEDPLLSCLVTLAGLLERPISAEALKAGLPHAEERFLEIGRASCRERV